MSIEHAANWSEAVDDKRELEYLPRILARQVLLSGTEFWSSDYLSRQMADDIAWEIGAQAHVVPVRLKNRTSHDGDSFALQIDHYDNVIHIHR